jgi:hypothetical protein
VVWIFQANGPVTRAPPRLLREWNNEREHVLITTASFSDLTLTTASHSSQRVTNTSARAPELDRSFKGPPCPSNLSVAHMGHRWVSGAWAARQMTTCTYHIVVEMFNRMSGRAKQQRVASCLPRGENWRETSFNMHEPATGSRSRTLAGERKVFGA